MAAVALGIDGAKLMDLGTDGTGWRLDPGLPADQQTGTDLYADNDVDRGHLARRSAACWGDAPAEAAQANEDTFHYTDAARRPPGSTKAWSCGSGWKASCCGTLRATTGA